MRKRNLTKVLAIACAISVATTPLSGLHVRAQSSSKSIATISLPSKKVVNQAKAAKKIQSVKVSSKTYEKTYKTEDGIVYDHIKYVRPVLKGNSKAIKKINSYLLKQENRWLKEAKKNIDGAKETVLSLPANSGYCADEMWYSINYNKKGIISIYFIGEYDGLGAHPFTNSESYTFDLNTGKVLTLGDLMSGSNSTIKNRIVNRFAKVAKVENGFYEDALVTVRKTVGKNCKRFYLYKNKLIIYYDVYEIACYAAGPASISIPLSKTAYFKKNLK